MDKKKTSNRDARGTKTIFFVLLLIGVVNGYAQCNTNKKITDDGYTYLTSQAEEIYSYIGENNNGDYSRGFTKVYVNSITAYKVDANKGVWGFELAYTSKLQKMIYPRKIIIYFEDGSNKEFSTQIVSQIPSGYRATVLLSDYEEIKLLFKAIKVIEVCDHWNNICLKTYPYRLALQELMMCISK